jgi:DNA repair protein RadC
MSEVAVTDRPREKLARVGVESLGDNELVALVLGSGTRSRGALIVAGDVLRQTEGVRGLAQFELEELCGVGGVGVSKAARLLAAVELGRRTLMAPLPRRRRFTDADAYAEYLMPRYSRHRDERFGVMLLDARQRLIRTMILSQGSRETSLAEPREVFRAAIAVSASSVVAFHNHPSGDPAPSEADRLATERLLEAGVIMGIEVADHLILGEKHFFSFREERRVRKK